MVKTIREKDDTKYWLKLLHLNSNVSVHEIHIIKEDRSCFRHQIVQGYTSFWRKSRFLQNYEFENKRLQMLQPAQKCKNNAILRENIVFKSTKSCCVS